MDLIGAPVFTNDFVVSGTCSENLYGMCESLYRPDLEADDLFETVSQALLSAVDRDALSGWGGIVHIITPEGVKSRTLKVRQD
jgi:20S proteasome subunit beta 3